MTSSTLSSADVASRLSPIQTSFSARSTWYLNAYVLIPSTARSRAPLMLSRRLCYPVYRWHDSHLRI